jgi:hypothetical protein
MQVFTASSRVKFQDFPPVTILGWIDSFCHEANGYHHNQQQLRDQDGRKKH